MISRACDAFLDAVRAFFRELARAFTLIGVGVVGAGLAGLALI